MGRRWVRISTFNQSSYSIVCRLWVYLIEAFLLSIATRSAYDHVHYLILFPCRV
ncbi:hypothetical protein HanPI659440_Chr15g0591421 [Helianthus annuus]|nr:hypothetical protein HanPI659440_Chr15g0591421 [Helianthus annuus]